MTLLLRRPLSALPLAVAAALVLYFLLQILGRNWSSPTTSTARRTHSGKAAEFNKTIVCASTKEESTSWLHNGLYDWNKAIYVVDDHTAQFHTQRNKGNEANVYLTYIIDNYDYIPDTVVFIHYHSWAAHIGIFPNTTRMIEQLNIPNLQRSGYASLSCFNKEDCKIEWSDWYNVGRNREVIDAWPTLFPETPMPKIVSAPRYGQFATTGTQVRKRPRSDYQRAHDWLMATEMEDMQSGRVLEWTWHVMFGQDPFFCVSTEACYAETYGVDDFEGFKNRFFVEGVRALPTEMAKEVVEGNKYWMIPPPSTDE